MIANYPIRIGVLEQAFSPPPSIDPGTGLFIRIGLLGSNYNPGGEYTLPLQPTNSEGVISWGDGSSVEAVPASSTGLQHTYPSDTWAGEIQTQWLIPRYGALEINTGTWPQWVWNASLGRFQWYSTPWWNSVAPVSSIKLSGAYSGTAPVIDGMAAGTWDISGAGGLPPTWARGADLEDLFKITGVTSMNQAFKGVPSGYPLLPKI